MITAANLKGAMKRLLTDLYWLRTEGAALQGLAGKDHIGIDFFKVAHTALFADYLHRLGRILDRHPAAGSFRAIHKYDSAAVEATLSSHGLTIGDLQSLAERFEPIRNRVLAHSDPRVALDPDALYKRANIKGRDIAKITNGLWAALRGYYQDRINKQVPSGDEYSGVDIDEIHDAYMRRQRGRSR